MDPILISETDRIFVLTGAGVSAESGLPTFRASDGLWEGHRIEDVCTPEALARNPALVWEFYSMRRAAAKEAQPNPAHLALAALERRMGDRFFLCTQNVDDLHSVRVPRGFSTCMASWQSHGARRTAGALPFPILPFTAR